MTGETPGADPALRLLDEAGLADDARLSALLGELRATVPAEPPTPSRDVARLMSGRRRAPAVWFARRGSRTTTVVLLVAALAGGASAAAAASPAIHAVVNDAFSTLRHLTGAAGRSGGGTETGPERKGVEHNPAGAGPEGDRKSTADQPARPPAAAEHSAPADESAAESGAGVATGPQGVEVAPVPGAREGSPSGSSGGSSGSEGSEDKQGSQGSSTSHATPPARGSSPEPAPRPTKPGQTGSGTSGSGTSGSGTSGSGTTGSALPDAAE